MEELDRLYSLYQFDKIEEKDDVFVYLYYNGYFKNIEILSFKSNISAVSDLRQKYENMGYAVGVTNFSSLQEIHHNLFNGFFYVDKFIRKCKSEYLDFCDMQTEKLKIDFPEANYKYIEGYHYNNNNLVTDTNLVEYIGNKMISENPKLIILEAAAGMGKTSTAYEVFNYLIDNKKNDEIPLFIELTKNRGARIFRYVLDDEINRNFTGLKRELVIEEIKNGNILLIIDGFDELLSKNNNEIVEDENHNAQTMLDTIAELFDENSNARIVLTSRKSSIFAGAQFDSWLDSRLANSKVGVERYQIAKPTVKQWIGLEKLEILEQKKVPLASLENPVLLSYLRYMSVDDLNNISNGKSIVEKYFDRLLNRERDRQDLTLSIAEQKIVYTDLAAKFVMFEIKSETSDFLKEIFLTIILKDKIAEYLSRYTNASTRPDEEEFVMKFVRHALLDRVKPLSNNIGFVNDFVFGTFIAEGIIKGLLSSNNAELISNNYISLAVDAFLIESTENKRALYNKLKELIRLMNDKQQLSIEIDLIKCLGRDYKNGYFDELIFSNIIIEKHIFTDCTFVNCTFEDCIFDLNSLVNCTFIKCNFYNVELLEKRKTENISFVNCIGEEIFEVDVPETVDEDKIDYRKKVLENFWAPGKEKAETRRSENAIFRGTRHQDRANIARAIEELVHNGIIMYGYSCYLLNYEKIIEIKEILGR